MKRVIAGVSAGLLVAACAQAAQDYTHVRNGSEATHLQLFNTLYGGGFGAVNTATASDNGGTGADVANSVIAYSNATWLFARTQDRNGSSPLQLDGSNSLTGAQDTNWADGVINVRVTAKVAGDSHTFGWYNDAGSGLFQSITPTVVGNTVNNLALSTDFRWGLDTSFHGELTSDEGDNTGGKDMMVTYAMFKNGDFFGWLLAWEDRLEGDFDYNDAWIEVALAPIPSPLAASMGAVALGGLATRRRR